jgi:hypothetical protein
MSEAAQNVTLSHVTIYVQDAVKCFIIGKYLLTSDVALFNSMACVDSLYQIWQELHLLVSISTQNRANTTKLLIFGKGCGEYELTPRTNDIRPFVLTCKK